MEFVESKLTRFYSISRHHVSTLRVPGNLITECQESPEVVLYCASIRNALVQILANCHLFACTQNRSAKSEDGIEMWHPIRGGRAELESERGKYRRGKVTGQRGVEKWREVKSGIKNSKPISGLKHQVSCILSSNYQMVQDIRVPLHEIQWCVQKA